MECAPAFNYARDDHDTGVSVLQHDQEHLLSRTPRLSRTTASPTGHKRRPFSNPNLSHWTFVISQTAVWTKWRPQPSSLSFLTSTKKGILDQRSSQTWSSRSPNRSPLSCARLPNKLQPGQSWRLRRMPRPWVCHCKS